jgi:hypothetical protein
MATKTTSGREMANSFPENSLVRMDTESIGQRLLHAIGTPFDTMGKALVEMEANQYVSTFNLDEIDTLYKVELPVDYTFSTIDEDPLNTHYNFPTARGLFINDTVSGWYSISGVNSNTVKEFWYETFPSRISLNSTVVSSHTLVASSDSTTFPKTTISDPHIPGKLTIDVISNNLQIINMDEKILKRGIIIITGITRKDTEESETIIFPWGMKQKTLQEWKEIEKVEAYNFPSGVMIGVYSGDFSNGPYLDAYNLHFSEYRNKIDTFWDVGTVGAVNTLDKIGYISDQWQQLVTGLDGKEVKRSWEILNTSGGSINAVDLAVQPFSNRVWIVDASNKLYCFDTTENMADDIDLIRDRDTGCHVKLDFEAKHVVYNEYIQFLPFYERPLQEIDKYRIWYQTPSGSKYGLFQGEVVSYSSDFWVTIEKVVRNLEPPRSVLANERGEWLFAIEVVFIDQTTQTYKALVTVDSKIALSQYNLSGVIPTTADGIDFDSDQQMWIKSGTSYYKINLHYDTMIVDYQNKVIYLREDYHTVEVD